MFIQTNVQANNIIQIHLAKNRHMINGLVNALKSINTTIYCNNLSINSLNYARDFLLTQAEIAQRLKQLCNRLRKLESNVSTIYNYRDSLRKKNNCLTYPYQPSRPWHYTTSRQLYLNIYACQLTKILTDGHYTPSQKLSFFE